MRKLAPAGFIIALLLCLSASAQDTAPARLERHPVSYGLVIDNSGSIRLLLDRVIGVVSDVVEGNQTEDEAFLVTFVDTSKIIIRQEFTPEKSEILDAAQNMFIEGGQTALLDAVKISAEYLAKTVRTDGDRARALILVTDGDDRGSGSKIEEVVRILKENQIRVYVIAVADGRVVTKLIDRLTKDTGGAKYTPRTKADLTATAAQISTAIRTKQ